ncbi:hypothetical protein GYMLUDRAFT_250653 [Collybiopsis luxurians FD-317 M1]|uniref:Unplaced genomic scaffold GYMLUscaffold_85, whole genome shotgun sequence n=1 Tax=Collybiopsis luxurians FD-317 M1 TaxID=944289 RepID=A0A0D0BTY9_9AGAR|nr:hypothetical protein GYMLUDRAFT_250653 [Collybiopsis luxurians FD-317 M1]
MLWRYIAPPAYRFDFILLLLIQSQKCPLTIKYHTNEHTFDQRVLALLAEHSEHWLEAAFCIPSSCYPLLNSVRQRIPLLKSLALTTNDCKSLPRIPGFDIAPNLRHLDLAFLCGNLVQKISAPWSQLIQLHCNFIEASSLYHLLLHTPVLSQLHICNLFDDLGTENFVTDIVFIHLKTIHASECSSRALHFFLRHSLNLIKLSIFCSYLTSNFIQNPVIPVILLCLQVLKIRVRGHSSHLIDALVLQTPSLSKVEFHSILGDRSEDGRVEEQWGVGKQCLHSLKDFIQRADCTLTHLNLVLEIVFDNSGMVSLLKALPSLETLNIVVPRIECVPFRAMALASQFFPKLHTFNLRLLIQEHTVDALNDLVILATSSSLLNIHFLASEYFTHVQIADWMVLIKAQPPMAPVKEDSTGLMLD